MRWSAVIGWGVVIYAVVFLAWSGLVVHGISTGILPHAALFVSLAAAATAAGRALRFHSWHDILPYSFLWAVIAALLDIVYAVPLSGWRMYEDWNLWAGYALIAVIPLLAPATRRSRHEMPDVS